MGVNEMSYTEPYYDRYRKWVKEARAKDISWQKIEFGLGENIEDLHGFLKIQEERNFWKINENDWKHLVIQEKDAEIYSIDANIYDTTQILSTESYPDMDEPSSLDSCWQQYVKKLQKKHFNEESINSIKESTLKILKNLKLTTNIDNPIKGMVVGNVQSGKTANMAALMSMAADYGWNFFIVLSGTIENLRVQTQNRLLKDLVFPTGNLFFQGLNDLKLNSDLPNSSSNIHLEDNSKIRYLYVSLKNATRLKNLLQWINKDQFKKCKMKILLIDDEADQAGINTADINEEERKKINQLIIDLVFARDHKNHVTLKGYKAINYIGYTATPYANLLNETKEHSLYPHSFIAALSVSKEYFGPQQIFGIEGNSEFGGLDIVNLISNDTEKKEIEQVSKIHKGISNKLPQTLKNAIAWFFVSVASLRTSNYIGSLSMLIHTSQKQNHHQFLYDSIQNWLLHSTHLEIYELCKIVWLDQTKLLTYEKFFNQYPKYGNLEVRNYLPFDDIERELINLIESKPSNIFFDSSQELIYTDGVHLCIDNCSYNGIDDEGKHLRLKYPDETNMPVKAPAFLVVGGSTLSRGLTIEGLVSTFFLRPVGQADTLMQMGRWFGYRRGYELYPRLWLTENTINQFKFLSKLDDELRKEIFMMEQRDVSPSEYAVKILNTPRLKFIDITNKKKMQSAYLAEVDYSGFVNHVTSFYTDEKILEENLLNTIHFVKQLKQPENKINNINPYAKNNLIWHNVSNESVLSLFKVLQFPNQPEVFLEAKLLEKWLNEMFSKGALTSWNVVLAGLHNGTKFHIDKLAINLVTRAKKETSTDTLIKLGVLRNPSDLLSDISVHDKDSELYQLLMAKDKMVEKTRSLARLDKTPLLIIYIVDKDSKAVDNRRVDLDAKCHLVGIYAQIPGAEKGVNHVTKIQAKIIMDFSKGDIE
jgi:hypothetical protein